MDEMSRNSANQMDKRPTATKTLPKLDLEVSILQQSVAHLKSLQRTDGYWWFALEANETIGSEFIFLMHYLGDVDEEILQGICRRICDVQREDGTWALYHDGPADLSTTIECYFALKLGGYSIEHPRMARARGFITSNGGIEKARVFTRIHLAMFGIVPWTSAAAMPAEFIFMPKWLPFSIYEFSSWARATIVPLLVFMSLRKTAELPAGLNLDEIFANPADERDFSFTTQRSSMSWENFFIICDKFLKIYEMLPLKLFRKRAINKCLSWTWEHVEKTEDIYPALAYCAFAFKAAGYDNNSPQISKPFEALKMFQQRYTTDDVAALPDEIRDDGLTKPSDLRKTGDTEINVLQPFNDNTRIHQQCCISPCWDTPWALTALLDSGLPADDPALIKSGEWLLKKQIKDITGDWAVKNPNAKPGGWAFEFENDFYPDVDDTIQIISVLHRIAIPERDKGVALKLGLDWVISMQNDDGGWGAFDRNQFQTLVDHIPFSDHGACLDPSSPDIVGRMLEFFADRGYRADDPMMRRALDYIWRTQESFGGWWARWGINYIYGTWCVLTGLKALGWDMSDERVVRAVKWLKSIQKDDGGFSECPSSYLKKRYIPISESVPSQTGWALMGLVAAGKATGASARFAAEYLFNNRNPAGSWDERHYTGTGFPGHFYIRYHGYRHFFPLMALGRYQRALGLI
jgi:squalene-hopene/tetraprenyl-beta-curcumene cyclase